MNYASLCILSKSWRDLWRVAQNATGFVSKSVEMTYNPVWGDKMSLHMKFSGTLLQKRRELRLTQQQMADRCEIALRTYQGLEGGHTLPTFETAAKIAQFCEISLDSIVKETDPNAFSLSSF